jgi:hypothetical protein
MKQDDIILIVGTMFVSAIFAILVTSTPIFGSLSKNQQVTVVSTINTSFQAPSSQFLNTKSIDPTLLVQIGNNSNSTPFAPLN